jgi:hypothetical protein
MTSEEQGAKKGSHKVLKVVLAVLGVLVVLAIIWGCPALVEGRKRQVTIGRCSNAIGVR